VEGARGEEEGGGMSITRWGCDGSDVYVFHNCDDKFECCGCVMLNHETFTTEKPEEMIVHLRGHEKRGDQVPGYAFETLVEWDTA
jgi:hypothetical protein